MAKAGKTVMRESKSRVIRIVTAVSEGAEKDTGFEVHTHVNEAELYYFEKGELFFAFEGERYRVEPGTVIIVADGTLHRPVLTAPCVYSRRRVLIRRDAFLGIAGGGELYGELKGRGMVLLSPEMGREIGIPEGLDRIGRALETGTGIGEACAVSVFMLLVAECVRADPGAEAKGNRVGGGRARDIVEYVNGHLEEDLSYGAIARRFFISEKSLYKLFKDETGFTLSSYVCERRVIRAMGMLAAGSGAAEAAEASGFGDYSVFYRSFLRLVGKSPAEYAKSVGQGRRPADSRDDSQK